MSAGPAAPGNDKFLRDVFGAEWQDAHVCGFAEDPGAVEPGSWAGTKWSRWTPGGRDALRDQNAYVAISTFDDEPGTGKAVRRKRLFRACHAIVVDDVGTKVPEAKTVDWYLPTWKIETSPGNFQWGYVLDVPETDAGRVNALLDGMVAAGIAVDGLDPGMKGVTRYVRLPEGVNRKAKLGPDGFRCRMTWWSLIDKVSIEDLANWWKIVLPPPGASSVAVAARARWGDPADDPIFALFERQGRVLGAGAGENGDGYHVRCPWDHEHSRDAVDTGTAYWPGGGFKCHHGHCEKRGRADIELWASRGIQDESGWVAPPVAPWALVPVSGWTPSPGPAATSTPGTTGTGTLFQGDEDPFIGQRWLVYGMLPERGVALISGQSRAGKTFVALDLAASIAGGQPFTGAKIDRPGGVLFVAAESAGELPTRWRAALAARGLAIGDTPMVWAARAPGKLLEPGGAAAFVDLARQAQDKLRTWLDVPLVAIVVDTLAVASGWTDENSNAEAQRAMDALREAGDAVGCLVIAVDHYGKDAGVGTRGASAKGANADAVLAVLADIDPSGAADNRRMAVAKCKGAQEGGVCEFVLRVETLGQDAEGRDITTCVVGWKGQVQHASRRGARPTAALKLPSGAAAALRVLRGMGGRADETLWRDQCTDDRSVSQADTRKGRAKGVGRSFATLLERGAVMAEGGEIWIAATGAADFSDDASVIVKPNGEYKT